MLFISRCRMCPSEIILMRGTMDVAKTQFICRRGRSKRAESSWLELLQWWNDLKFNSQHKVIQKSVLKQRVQLLTLQISYQFVSSVRGSIHNSWQQASQHGLLDLIWRGSRQHFKNSYVSLSFRAAAQATTSKRGLHGYFQRASMSPSSASLLTRAVRLTAAVCADTPEKVHLGFGKCSSIFYLDLKSIHQTQIFNTFFSRFATSKEFVSNVSGFSPHKPIFSSYLLLQ